jgi:hypothetical protein
MHHHMGPWFCEMNLSDRARAACDAPEQAWDEEEEEGEEEEEEEVVVEEEEAGGEEGEEGEEAAGEGASGLEGMPCPEIGPEIGPGWRRVSKSRRRHSRGYLATAPSDSIFVAPDGRRFYSRVKATN